MTYISKPSAHHPALKRNAVGLTRRDYEGSMSTLCAGCGHDSITAAIIESCFQLDLPPHRIAKISGIGCSSKSPTYFMSQAHGFNSVHGRMRLSPPGPILQTETSSTLVFQGTVIPRPSVLGSLLTVCGAN